MKNLTKLENAPEGFFERYDRENATAQRSVQGGLMQTSNGVKYVESGKRFKLYSDRDIYVKILSGEGFFKWARGETKFASGDVFLMQAIGEFELNGACTFMTAEN